MVLIFGGKKRGIYPFQHWLLGSIFLIIMWIIS